MCSPFSNSFVLPERIGGHPLIPDIAYLRIEGEQIALRGFDAGGCQFAVVLQVVALPADLLGGRAGVAGSK